MNFLKLIRVAKDVNMGLHSIVEILREKGFEIEEKPTAEISPEAHNVLLPETRYQK